MDLQLFSWIALGGFVVIMLAIDMYLFHGKDHVITTKEALTWTAAWVLLALSFCTGVYFVKGPEAGLNFLAGYLLEKSLSVDNLFIFLMIFTYFAVPEHYLHKILFWGVFGALVMRGIFIFAGIALIQYFHWIIYLFGIFLIYAGWNMARGKNEEIDPEKNFILRMFRKIFPVTKEYVNGHFFIFKEGRYWATPLFIVLLFVEMTDILFAFDSVPAILAITTDPFIVYSSNIFAVLGLRSLYFALPGAFQLFHYLNYGLAALLIFIGAKMLMADFVQVPVGITLLVIVLVLATAIGASFLFPKKDLIK